jgi:glycosyltransferase involved in cell wall biosynthesis
MRYSILLPTRNGGALLEACVRSILDQPGDDFELVVSNNASEDDTPEILEGFSDDPRLAVVTLDRFVEVTDNWNVALERSSGDYITLLGDDDLLLPGYFRRADELLERHGFPDCLTYNAFAYASPGLGGSAESHYADPFYEVDPLIPRGRPLPAGLRHELVTDLFRFRFRMHLNLQGALIARRAAASLPAGLFREPFPDFYALNALLLRAKSWVHTDERMAVIGISPKSFGQALHSSRDRSRGLGYLGISTDFPGQLPGSELINGTYRTLLALAQDFPDELSGVSIHRRTYVVQQLHDWYLELRLGSLGLRAVLRRLTLLRASDVLAVARLALVRSGSPSTWRQLRVSRSAPVQSLRPGMRPLPGITSITEFASWVAAAGRRPPEGP